MIAGLWKLEKSQIKRNQILKMKKLSHKTMAKWEECNVYIHLIPHVPFNL